MQTDVRREHAGGLSEDDVRSFWDRGFLVVDDVVTGALLDEIRALVDDYVQRSRRMTKSEDPFDLEPSHTAEEPRLRRIKSPARFEETFRRIAFEGAIPAIVAQLIGPNVKYHHGKVNLKNGRGGSEARWHQDFAFMPHSNADVVAVALALDDSTRENGCVVAVPGSHRGPVYSHYDERGQFVGAITEPLGDELLATALPMELRPGSISIHHGIAVHGSATNDSGKARRLFINQYVAADAFAVSPNSSPSEYDGRIVAGERSRTVRFEARTTLMPPDWSGGYRSFFALQTGNADPNY